VPKKNPKPLTVLVDVKDYPLFKGWNDKGHTVIHTLPFDGHPYDGIISSNAKVLNPKSTFLSVEKQLAVIEKALRAVKYPVKKKGK